MAGKFKTKPGGPMPPLPVAHGDGGAASREEALRRLGCCPGREWASGSLRVLQKLNDDEFGVELWILRDGVNNNRWDFRNLEQHYKTFLGRPILCAYVGSKIGDGHNMREVRTPKGKTYYTFTDGTAERIVGIVSEDPADIRLERVGGNTWIVAKGRLFAFYAPELVEKIVRTGRMDVSAETEVKDGEKVGDVEIYSDWTGIGVTILGDDVAPAVPGARIAALAAMEEEFAGVKLRAAALRNNEHNKGAENYMNKRAIAKLAPKFEGYRIVALSEDGLTVGMVDAGGAPYTYRFAKDSGEVVSAKPTAARWKLSLCAGDVDFPVDMDEMLDHVVAEKKLSCQSAEDLQTRLDAANEKIRAMEEAEHNRRVEAVKDCFVKVLADMAEMDSEICAEVKNDILAMQANADRYAALEQDGKFIGCETARAEAMAKFAEAQMKKLQAEKQRRSSAFAWNNAGGSEGSGDSIEDLLRAING